MALPKCIVRKSKKYWLQTTGRYYLDGNKTAKERLLHRVVWKERNGDIPKGMCVHHKNGDWTDNRIANMELVEFSKHAGFHLSERWRNPKQRAALMRCRPAILAAAAKWHGTKEGLAWHSENGKRAWDKRKRIPATCQECGKRCGRDGTVPARRTFRPRQ